MLSKIVILVCFAHICTGFKLPVCCPMGYQLVDANSGRFGYGKFECKQNNDTLETVFGFNIFYTNTSEIPKCDNPLLVNLRDIYTRQISTRSCVTKYLNEIQAIYCPEYTPSRFGEVNIVQKCCPYGKVYDYLEKRCVESKDLNVVEKFSRYFQNPTVLEYSHKFGCPADKVIVDYYSEFNDFTFRENDLFLSNKVYGYENMKFSQGSYCVENVILNTSEIESDQKIVDHQYVYKDNFTLLSNLPNEMFVVRSCNDRKVCENIPCIRKCCAENEELKAKKCVPSETDLNVSFHRIPSQLESVEMVIPKVYGIHRGLTCKRYRLEPDEDESEVHYFSYLDGSMFMANVHATYPNDNYCIEIEKNMMSTFLCFEKKEEDLKFKVYPILILISCAFFAVTLIVYLTIPKLRNLPGKILICLVLSLLVAYLGIAYGQLSPPSDKHCANFAFFIYFSLISAFSWMNVMCFDIWLTFGSSERSSFQSRQRKRFLFYNLYGWGLPIFFTIITICFTKFDIISETFRPNFAQGLCWFQHDARAAFFLVPIGVLIIANFVFFVMTLKYCNRVKREIHRMQSSNEQKKVLRVNFFVDRAQFMMNTKLFVVMGITWVMELLSACFYSSSGSFPWYITDSFNVLLGILIFLIFVFKRRVWNEILQKLGIKNTVFSTCATQATTVSSNAGRLRSMTTSSSLLNVNGNI